MVKGFGIAQAESLGLRVYDVGFGDVGSGFQTGSTASTLHG